MPSYDRALLALRTWPDSWSGIGHVAVGMHRQGFDLQLTQYDERGWRSMFEVHDNITREEIMELEAVLLAIFRYDPRPLTNKQKGSRKLSLLRRKLVWK